MADHHGVALIEDAAQSHLATLDGRPTGSFGQSGCFSFYPGKNLGAAGEGGAVVTDDEAVADRVRRLRDHAQDGRHNHVEVGYNYRMEGLQGAVLRVKLRHLACLDRGSARGRGALRGAHRHRRRDAAPRRCRRRARPGTSIPSGSPTATAWARGSRTPAWPPGSTTRLPCTCSRRTQHLGYRRGQFPCAEEYAATCLSLPMYAELTGDQQAYVAEQLRPGGPVMGDRQPLVIGGAGFIGSALVRHLAAQGAVRVLDDLSTGTRANLEGVPGVDLIEADLLDEDQLGKALTGVDVVYHLACLGVRHSIHQPFRNHQVNAEGTLRILETSRRLGVDRVVYCSTSEVYGTAERVPMDEDHPTWPHTVYGGVEAGRGGLHAGLPRDLRNADRGDPTVQLLRPAIAPRG